MSLGPKRVPGIPWGPVAAYWPFVGCPLALSESASKDSVEPVSGSQKNYKTNGNNPGNGPQTGPIGNVLVQGGQGDLSQIAETAKTVGTIGGKDLEGKQPAQRPPGYHTIHLGRGDPYSQLEILPRQIHIFQARIWKPFGSKVLDHLGPCHL